MSDLTRLRHHRVAVLVAALLCVFVACPAAAETRSLKLYFLHTKERATITYKKNGRYMSSGLKKVNRFLRDWRRNEPTKMDPRLLDLLWEVYRASGSKKHIHVVSAYRSPQTNAMLRRRSKGVASKSQHMLGRAMDFYIPDVKLSKLRRISMKAQVGGVGYYPRSGSPFIHLDVGSVRSWPRMSRKELAGVFPKGKTLHLPKDGKPLPGYKQAMADYKSRVSSKEIKIAGKRSSGGGNLLAGIFGGNRDRDEEKPARTRTRRAVASAPAAPKRAPKTVEFAFVPTPRPAPPDGGVQLAFATAETAAVEVALAPTMATSAVAIPEGGGVPIPVLQPGFNSTGSDVVQSAVSIPGAAARPSLDAGTRVTLASAPQAVTAGAFLLAPATVETVDAGLTVATVQSPADNPLTASTPENTAQLAFVPRPTIRPNAIASDAVVLATAFNPRSRNATEDKTATGIPVPAPSPFERLSGVGEMITLPVEVALAPPSAVSLRSNGILESAFALQSKNGKGGRPDARDAEENRRRSVRKEPVLIQNLATRRTFAANRVAAMNGPARAPHFVSAYMRSAPDTVHMEGFSTENRVAGTDSFTGRAVNFMTVARFVVRN